MSTPSENPISLSAATRAAGAVTLACAEPGGWRFSIEAEPGDAETVPPSGYLRLAF
ncbi:MAG: hypothetical protein IJS46_02250 [Kiritimatiellae bacterium]|nr:hypothetical protein [Kiritimatiellia bacterium]